MKKMKWSNIPKYIIHTYIYDNYTAVYVRVCVYKYFVFLYTKFKNCRRKEHSDANTNTNTPENCTRICLCIRYMYV